MLTKQATADAEFPLSVLGDSAHKEVLCQMYLVEVVFGDLKQFQYVWLYFHGFSLKQKRFSDLPLQAPGNSFHNKGRAQEQVSKPLPVLWS